MSKTLRVLAIFVCLAALPAVIRASSAGTATEGTRAIHAAASVATLAADAWASAAAGGLDAKVLHLALQATRCAVQSGDLAGVPATLTVIDYSKPSSSERLWVFDLVTHALLYRELVAHGQGSGENLPTRFSNEADTHQSSLGLFSTDEAYVGKNGYSLRLNGLEDGVNDRARERAIVMHGAPYVSDAFVKQQGRLGRSWGCPAVRAPIARELIDRLKGGGALFAYYPDPGWLRASKFLSDCSTARS
jgi:hypothetical protein